MNPQPQVTLQVDIHIGISQVETATLAAGDALVLNLNDANQGPIGSVSIYVKEIQDEQGQVVM